MKTPATPSTSPTAQALNASHNGALDTLRSALDAALVDLSDADVSDAIGACAAAQARLFARITAPAPVTAPTTGALVTADVVADRFSLAVSTVHEMARLGHIPCHMFGRYRRFDLAEVAAAGLNPKTASLAPEKDRNGNRHLPTPVTTQSPRHPSRRAAGGR
jgi:hypothetical protein